MLKIHGRANSFDIRKVLWICDELGIAYEREDWGRGFTPTSTPEFLWESNAIVRYLATKDGPEEIYPRDPVERAHVEQWTDWANYETSISLRGAFLGGVLNEPPWNNPLVY